LFGPGISCSKTLDYVARVLGDAERTQQSETVAERGRRSTTSSSAFRPLAPPNAIRERASGSMLLLYGSAPPAIVRLRPWYRDRRLRRLAGDAGGSR
jgi:type IV secretory pathway TraG/TraD family ATPase VirD4